MPRKPTSEKPRKRASAEPEEGILALWEEPPAIPEMATEEGLDFDDAVARFMEYLRAYRSYSPLTVAAYRRDLALFRKFLQRRAESVPQAGAITRQLVVQFALSLSGAALRRGSGQAPKGDPERSRGAAPLTVRRKLACLSSFFGFLEDMGHIRGNPAHRLPLPKVDQPLPVCLSEAEIRRLVTAGDDPLLRALVVLLLTTGLRRAEAVSITLDNVDLKNGQLLVHGKGAKERIVPLSDPAIAEIQHYLRHRPTTNCDRLFVSQSGGPLHPQAVNRLLEGLLERAGLEGRGITPHKLRHTFATQLIRQGVDVRTVQDLLGHNKLDTTARYLHSDTRSKRAAVDRLSDLVALPDAAG